MRQWSAVLMLLALTVVSCRSSLTRNTTVESVSATAATDELSAVSSVQSRRDALGDMGLVIDEPCLVVVSDRCPDSVGLCQVMTLTARRFRFESSESEKQSRDSLVSLNAVSSTGEKSVTVDRQDMSGGAEVSAGRPAALVLLLLLLTFAVFLLFRK